MRIKNKYFRKLSESSKLFIIFLEIIIGLTCSILSLITFNEIAEYATSKNIAYIDSFFVTLALSIRTPFLTETMLFFTHLGGPLFLSLATLSISLFLLKKHKRETALFLIAMIMGVVLNVNLKTMFDRQRPQLNPLVMEASKSFPSAHAMNNFIFYALLVFLIFHLSKSKKLTAIAGFLAMLIVLLIGSSRMYLGVHYFSDVMAGFVAGFWWLVTILSVAYTMILFELLSPKLTLEERIITLIKKILNAMGIRIS
jgi:undecaprenyl-diphosphatase